MCSMNLTLSVDETDVKRARKVAESMGTSLNQLIRDYLKELAGQSSAEAEIQELKKLSVEAQGRSRGWKFDREEIHRRP